MTPEENQTLMCVGPGTLMGNYLRSHWLPALRSARVEAGGKPVKARLLGENFVAFRRTNGSVGFVDEACPHRGASLALARNDGEHLECLFHCWKIDTCGKVADCPNVPDALKFAAQVKTRYYPVVETGNMIWVYLGADAGGEPPAFPTLGCNQDAHASPHGAIVYCNWVQLMEGTLDPNHVAYLHSHWLPAIAIEMFRKTEARYEMVDHAYGFTAASVREFAPGMTYARVKEIIFPFAMDVPFDFEAPHTTIMCVPIDDETTYLWYISYAGHASRSASGDAVAKGVQAGASHEDMFWLGADARPDAKRNPDNFRENMPYNPDRLWGQDRAAMAQGHATGFLGLVIEDIAVTESMGRQVDRSRETLNATDAFVARFRRRILAEARAFAEGQRRPEIDYSTIRSREGMLPEDKTWKDLPRFAGDPRLLPPLPTVIERPTLLAQPMAVDI